MIQSTALGCLDVFKEAKEAMTIALCAIGAIGIAVLVKIHFDLRRVGDDLLHVRNKMYDVEKAIKGKQAPAKRMPADYEKD